MNEQQRTEFDGWAIVDVLGHQRYAGRVKTEYFGTTAFFRVETPARAQRERVLTQEEYVGHNYGFCKEGTRVVVAGKAETVRLVGAGSIYMLSPSTEADVMAHLDEAEPCAIVSVLNPDGTPVELAEPTF